jgi:amidase
MEFKLIETTIDQIHAAYRSGELTCRQLVEMYLARINDFDKAGPEINAIITVNPNALVDADRLDAAQSTGGFVGPLHGIPVIVKDQCDALPMPTTLGSLLFKDNYPDRDAFVVEKLRDAGGIILGKSTLGELAAGDTHGSLFGSTKNPYDFLRTAGGSSGGSGASVASNFCTIAVGQEGYASICRPSSWNCVVGIRPTAGLVSRSGVYGGWPLINGTLGPMARNVSDVTKLLDVMVGYDPEDPLTAYGQNHLAVPFASFLDKNGLEGARIGVLRESIGVNSEPDSEDFRKVDEVFNQAVNDLRSSGAFVVDPIVIPDLKLLLSLRANSPTDEELSLQKFMARSKNPPYRSRSEVMNSPEYSKVNKRARDQWAKKGSEADHYQFLKAREQLMTNLLNVMASHNLDAICMKSVEHQSTYIKDGVNPPFVNHKGAHHLSTFLVYVPSVIVPAGFTRDNQPAGVTFLGRPYEDGKMIKLAFAYEQATLHRKEPRLEP